jgi:hypothetical protein
VWQLWRYACDWRDADLISPQILLSYLDSSAPQIPFLPDCIPAAKSPFFGSDLPGIQRKNQTRKSVHPPPPFTLTSDLAASPPIHHHLLHPLPTIIFL